MENKEISIEEYLKNIGFDEEEVLNILGKTNIYRTDI